MNGFVIFLLSVICFWLILTPVMASQGDSDNVFLDCVVSCLNSYNHEVLSLHMTMFFWDIDSNCQYECMFNVTEQRIAGKREILKYHGKWPFLRLFGIQEPASALFSLLNGVAQVIGWHSYKYKVDRSYKFYNLTRCQFVVNLVAWLCAMVFHTRDFYWTEKLDYFSTVCVIGMFVFTFFTRVTGTLNDRRIFGAGMFLSVLFGYHIYYMAVIKFDYGYNMKFMLANGVLNISLWLLWCCYYRVQKPYVWKCALTMSAMFCLAAWELWDFPPVYWILDGHALWHLSTIPFSYFWYSFLIDEAFYDIRKTAKLP